MLGIFALTMLLMMSVFYHGVVTVALLPVSFESAVMFTFLVPGFSTVPLYLKLSIQTNLSSCPLSCGGPEMMVCVTPLFYFIHPSNSHVQLINTHIKLKTHRKM